MKSHAATVPQAETPAASSLGSGLGLEWDPQHPYLCLGRTHRCAGTGGAGVSTSDAHVSVPGDP